MPSFDVTAIFHQLSQINLSEPTWDIFILLFFVVGSLIYGLSLGRERVIMLIVAVYMALAVVNTAPYLKTFTANVSLGRAFAFQITTFVGVFLVLFFFVSRSALSHSFRLGDHGRWWQVLTFSALHMGLLTSIILSYLPVTALAHLSATTRQIFTGDAGKFAWVVLPIVAMLFLQGGEKAKE